MEENNNYQKNRKITRLEENGIEILYVAEKNGHIDLNDLMQKLGERSIDSILLEGGGILNWSALKSGIVNTFFISYRNGKEGIIPREILAKNPLSGCSSLLITWLAGIVFCLRQYQRISECGSFFEKLSSPTCAIGFMQ